jgi:uncharacterized protein (DUF305 family)
MRYRLYFAMIATSTVVMFILMYLNTYALDHLQWSETRVYMAVLMGATMAVIMMGFMWPMYEGRVAKIGIMAGAVAVFAGALWLVRSQETVQDVSWMQAMIPHHSIAILTSERAELSDPRVIDLSRRIIEAQRLEIDEMTALIADLQGGPPATPEVDGD